MLSYSRVVHPLHHSTCLYHPLHHSTCLYAICDLADPGDPGSPAELGIKCKPNVNTLCTQLHLVTFEALVVQVYH